MRAIVTEPPGGWDHTSLKEVSDPVPQPDECLVEIRAFGLNPADYFQIEGAYPGGPKPPFIDGRDGAGVVISSDSAGLWPVGSKVLVLQTTSQNLAQGTFATKQKFPAEVLAAIPEGWSFEEAAAASLVYMTAWRALVVQGGLTKGMAVMVTGASGGVGSAAVQLAAGLGATVIALSRSEEKRRKLLATGASAAFDPADKDLKNKVFAAADKKGVDLVVETVGGASLKTAVHLLGNRGKVAVVGLLAGVDGIVPIPSLMFKQCSVEGVVVSAFTPTEAVEAWSGIVKTLARTSAKPIVDSVFPMNDYLKAFERLRASPFGKVVVSTR